MPLQTHVSVAKAGVDALSNNIALEFGPRGLTSNVVSPGPIAGTEGMERLSSTTNVADSLKRVPLGRWGTVKEIADATVFLFSDAADYVNGQTLVGELFFFLFSLFYPLLLDGLVGLTVSSFFSRWWGVADGDAGYGRFQVSRFPPR